VKVITPNKVVEIVCVDYKLIRLSILEGNIRVDLCDHDNGEESSLLLSPPETEIVLEFIDDKFLKPQKERNKNAKDVCFSEDKYCFKAYFDHSGDPYQEGIAFELQSYTSANEDPDTVITCFTPNPKELSKEINKLVSRIAPWLRGK